VNRPSTSLKVPQKEQCGPTRRLSYPNTCSRGYTASYPWGMTVREMLRQLQHLPQDAEVLAFEAGCEK
jgi:hypothetical protein